MRAINILFIALIFLFSAKNADAYLDPGTGSFIFQIAVGAILGGIVAIKVKFKQIKDFSSSLFRKKNKDISKEN